MNSTREHALKNQALYWKAFAGLAVVGKRNAEDFQREAFRFVALGVPEDEDVEAIIREAQAIHFTKGE